MKSYCGERKIIRGLISGRKTLWELLASYHWTLRDFVNIINELYEEGVIKTDGKYIYLKKPVPKEEIFTSVRCPKCLGRAVLPKKLNPLVKKFKKLTSERPKPLVSLLQGYMRPEDVFARIALMHEYGDVEEKSIILVGDDDLVSIGLALTRMPQRITVIDADERLGDFLEKISKNHGLNIEFINHDVSNPLPKELRQKFDVFVTDPLETLSGLRAFLSRAVSALKPCGSSGYFGLTTLEASPTKWLWLQKFLTRMNLAMTDAIREHSSYPTKDYEIGFLYEKALLKNLRFEYKLLPPNVDWYKSTFIRVEAVGRLKPLDSSKKIELKVHDGDDVTWPEDVPS
jgi:predicted methyltransferase